MGSDELDVLKYKIEVEGAGFVAVLVVLGEGPPQVFQDFSERSRVDYPV